MRLPDGVSQMNAAIWQGLEFRIQRQQFDFNETEDIGQEDGTIKTVKKFRFRNMPTEFVGVIGTAVKGTPVAEVVKATPKATVVAAVAKTEPEITEAAAAPASTGGGPVAAFIAGLSAPFKIIYGKKAADLDTEAFMMWAIERPEVMANDAILNAAMNDGELQKALAA